MFKGKELFPDETPGEKSQSIYLGIQAEIFCVVKRSFCIPFSFLGDRGGKQISYSIITQNFEKA